MREDHAVEKILNIKSQKGLFGEFPRGKVEKESRYFLIKWEGFDESEATWEPENHLIDCEYKISTYLLQTQFKKSKRITLTKRINALHNQLLDEAEELIRQETRLTDDLKRIETKMNSSKPMSTSDVNIRFNQIARMGKSRIPHEPEIIEILDSSDEEESHKCNGRRCCCELGNILKELKSMRKKSKRKRIKSDIKIKPVELIVSIDSQSQANQNTDVNCIIDSDPKVHSETKNFRADTQMPTTKNIERQMVSVGDPISQITATSSTSFQDDIVDESLSIGPSKSSSQEQSKPKHVLPVTKTSTTKVKHSPKFNKVKMNNPTISRAKYLSTLRSKMKKESKRTLAESICTNQYVVEQKRITKKEKTQNTYDEMKRAFYGKKISLLNSEQNAAMAQMILEEF